MQSLFQRAQLLHHRLVDLQSPRGVDDGDTVALTQCFSDAGSRDLHYVGGASISIDRNGEISTEGLQLIYCCRPIDVSGNESGRAAFRLESPGELGSGGCLSGTLEPDHHHDRRRDCTELQSFAALAQHCSEL